MNFNNTPVLFVIKLLLIISFRQSFVESANAPQRDRIPSMSRANNSTSKRNHAATVQVPNDSFDDASDTRSTRGKAADQELPDSAESSTTTPPKKTLAQRFKDLTGQLSWRKKDAETVQTTSNSSKADSAPKHRFWKRLKKTKQDGEEPLQSKSKSQSQPVKKQLRSQVLHTRIPNKKKQSNDEIVNGNHDHDVQQITNPVNPPGIVEQNEKVQQLKSLSRRKGNDKGRSRATSNSTETSSKKIPEWILWVAISGAALIIIAGLIACICVAK